MKTKLRKKHAEEPETHRVQSESLPFFSIIVPAYNEERYLPLCLDSINNLDYPRDNYEIIVVDNGSTDRTRNIARTNRAKVLRDDSKNVAGLRNLGLKHADGDILAFVDADCVVSKDWLIYAARYFDAPDVAAWGAPAVPPANASWVQQSWFLVRQKEAPVQAVDWLETMNLFVLKKHALEIGGFNEALETCEDVDFCYRIRRFGQIISDVSLKVIHFGEAATLDEFARKEIWRGRGNLKGIMSHGFSLKELPSLAIPFYFGLFLPLLFLLAAVTVNLNWLIIGILFLVLPALLVLIRIRKRISRHQDVLRLFALLQVYFFSRTIAVIKRA